MLYIISQIQITPFQMHYITIEQSEIYPYCLFTHSRFSRFSLVYIFSSFICILCVPVRQRMFTRPCLAKCKGKIGCPDDAHGILSLFLHLCVCVHFPYLCLYLYLCDCICSVTGLHDVLVMYTTHSLCIASHEGEMIMR